MRRFLFALPILIAIGVLLATWRGGGPPPRPTTEAGEAQPRYVLNEGRWTRFSEEGHPQFEATAQTIEYFDDDSAQLHTVEMRSLGGPASPWRLNAPEAYSPPHSDRMELRGMVTAIAHWPEGETANFQTPRLWVDEKKHQLYTDAPVQMRGRSRNANADGLRADWIGKTVELLGQVRMQYAQPN